jgi:fluoroacetyl-CoA thioesterase
MKPGLAIGQTHTIEIEVTPDMVAYFEGKLVHNLYSTSVLAHHMELAARRLLVPFLSSNEESMGCNFEISHLAMTLPGMRVTIEATVVEIRDNKIVANIEASNIRGKLARGTVTQAIIDKGWLQNRMKEISVIHNITSEKHSRQLATTV